MLVQITLSIIEIKNILLMKHLNVVAAVIKNENKYLCMQRNESKYDYISYKYEFPGGKIEIGEDEISALKREIKEELDIEISVGEKLTIVNHTYKDFSISMHCYLCEALNIELKLKDHINFQWLEKEKLEYLDWAAADIPVLNHL